MRRACPPFEIIYASIRISKNGAPLLDSGLRRQPDLPNSINVLDLFECTAEIRAEGGVMNDKNEMQK
jgi:hypothetical protein